MYCCEWFSNAISSMNANGISIVPRKEYGWRHFAIRFRAVDPVLWASLSSNLPKGTPFASAAELSINNCPGCGTKLEDWIAENSDAFEALVLQVVD